MFTLNETAAAGSELADFPAAAGRVVGEAFVDQVESNPVPMFMLSRELTAAREAGPKLPAMQVREEAKRAGVAITVPEDGMSREAAAILIERRRDDAARQLLFTRREGAIATGGMFAAGIAGAMLDPLNVALGFVPVLSGTRYAAKLAEATTMGSRAAVRAGIGAAEGAFGAVVAEVPTLQLRRELQDEYSLYDSLANIAFGTVASAGIRGIGGAARDAYLGIGRAREIDALRAIEPEVWTQMKADAANAEERAFWTDLEAGFQRGEGIPEAMRAGFARDRFDIESRGAAAEFAQGLDEERDFRRATLERITQAADEAIERRFQRDRQRMLAAGIEPDEALRQAFAKNYPETEKRLLSAAEIGQARLAEYGLADARQRIAEGRGLVMVPRNDAEALAMMSPETHAQALKAAVAQAIEGRVIDVSAVTRRDPSLGPQRLTVDDARRRAQSNQAPEAKVGADRQASERAAKAIEKPEVKAAPKAKAPKGGQEEEKSPELQEAEQLLADAKALLNQAAAEWRPAASELLAAGAGKADAKDASLVARAVAKDAERVAQLGVEFAEDDAAFMRAIKELLGDDADSKAAARGVADRDAKGTRGKGREGELDEVTRAEEYARAWDAAARCAIRGGE